MPSDPGSERFEVRPDPNSLFDSVTPDAPRESSLWIRKVRIAGVLVHDSGRSAGHYPGRVVSLSGGNVRAPAVAPRKER